MQSMMSPEVETCLENITFASCRSVLTLVANKCKNGENLKPFSYGSATNSSSVSLALSHLIQSLTTNYNLTTEPLDHGEEEDVQKPSSAQIWGIGMAFVVVVCGISQVGSLLGPCMKSRHFRRIMTFFVALSASTLGTTGTLVLIPEALGLEADDNGVPDYAWKMTAVIGGVYFFYMFERILKIGLHGKKQKGDADSDIIVSPPTSNHNRNRLHPEEVEQVETNDRHLSSEEVECKNRLLSEEGGFDIDDSNILMENMKTDVTTTAKEKKRVAPFAWLLLISDGLDKLVDGIAMGAAFTESLYLGIMMSIACICEELPHELGDVAMFLHAGMSLKKALFLNFLASVPVFAGFVIGILIGENTNANEWVFAVAAGMCLYIGLSDMIPEMEKQAFLGSRAGENPICILLIQNFGMLTGYAITCILIVVEENVAG